MAGYEKAPGLPAQIQSLQNFLITLVVGPGQIVQKFPTARHQFQKSAAGGKVFFVTGEVLGKMVDPPGKAGNLHVGASSVAFVELEVFDFCRYFAHCCVVDVALTSD